MAKEDLENLAEKERLAEKRKKRHEKESAKKEEVKEEKINIDRILPAVEASMRKFLGVKVEELNRDISDQIKKGTLVGVDIDTSLDFKKAKKNFKKEYLKKLLTTNYGNISLVAKIADVDRRSIHRLLSKSKKDLKKIREEMLKKDYVRKQVIGRKIENILPDYESIIHPERLEQVYKNLEEVSEEIASEIEEEPLTLREAEDEFEKEYLMKALKENNNNVSETAKKIKLRYETLHRKLKKLDFI